MSKFSDLARSAQASADHARQQREDAEAERKRKAKEKFDADRIVFQTYVTPVLEQARYELREEGLPAVVKPGDSSALRPHLKFEIARIVDPNGRAFSAGVALDVMVIEGKIEFRYDGFQVDGSRGTCEPEQADEVITARIERMLKDWHALQATFRGR